MDTRLVLAMSDRWRKPLRLTLWDYTQPAIYHITICIANRTNRLARPEGTTVELTAAGRMVEEQLLHIPDRYPSVGIDSFVIMPNHVHFIIEMNLQNPDGIGTDLSVPIQAFKSLTTREYSSGVRELNWPPYRGILWQKRYFETIMRNEKSLERHRRYIQNNPANWWRDPEEVHRDSRRANQ